MIKGVAHSANLVSVRVAALSADSGDCPTGQPCVLYALIDTVSALDYVFDNRTALSIASVNLSYGRPTYAESHCDASFSDIAQQVDLLTGAGVAVVAASGNDGEDANYVGTMAAPACIENVVSVASVDKSGQVAYYSNISPTLDLFAPGGNGAVGGCTGAHQCVLSAVTDSAHDFAYGTSMAAPHVAGAIAALRTVWPQSAASVASVVAHLKDTGVAVSYGPGQSKPLLDLGLAVATPAAVGNVTVQRMLCYGTNLVSWTSGGGSPSHYQVEGSGSAGFDWPFALHSGTATFATIDVSGTTWIRVRACNGPSCSAWTPGDITATYTAGCI